MQVPRNNANANPLVALKKCDGTKQAVLWSGDAHPRGEMHANYLDPRGNGEHIEDELLENVIPA